MAACWNIGHSAASELLDSLTLELTTIGVEGATLFIEDGNLMAFPARILLVRA
jgi:hypothetical protein